MVRCGALAFAFLVVVSCRSFGASASAPSDGTPDAGPADAAPDPDSALAKEDAHGCPGTFCEAFDDDQLESRGWSRAGAGIRAEAHALHVDEANQSTAYLVRPLGLQAATAKVTVDVTVRVDLAGGDDVDLVAFHGASTPVDIGLFFSRLSTVYQLGTQDSAQQEQLAQTSLDLAVTKTLHIVLDFKAHTASLTSNGADYGPINLPAELTPSSLYLFLGVSWANGADRWTVSYSDLEVDALL